MDLSALLQNGFWASLFALALALSSNAPPRALPLVLAAGFAGRFGRDLVQELGVALPLATVLAALAVTVLAVAAARERSSVPVVAITAVLPLGPTPFLFNAIHDLLQVFAADPAVAAGAAGSFIANSLKASVVIAALGIGIALPLLLSRDRY